LRGSGFEIGATVLFAGEAAAQVLVAGPGRVIATSPEGIEGHADVVVTNPDGQVFTAHQGFEYVASTQVRGRVLDSNLVPVANVLVDLTPTEGLPIQAATDATGHFVLEDVPPGERTVKFNPANAGAAGGPSYPALQVPVEVVEGEINLVGGGRPTFLPILDTSHLVQIDPAASVTLSSSAPSLDPTVSGAILEVTAGNAVDENGNPYSGELLISEVPANRAPVQLNVNTLPPYLITVQPAGVEFLVPAPISFPNLDELAPGAQLALLGMNHETGVFEEVGTLEVNATGDRLETIDGGVYTSSWYRPPPPGFDPVEPPECEGDECSEDGGDPDKDCEANAGSTFNFATGNLKVSHRLLDYSVGYRRAALEFVYTLQGATPLAQIRSRFGLPDAGVYSNTRVRVTHDGQELYLSNVPGRGTGQVNFIDSYIPAEGLETGVHRLEVSITGLLGTRVQGLLLDAESRLLSVWNARDSAIGVGWGITGLDRIYQGTSEGLVLLASADGAALVFETPPGGVGTAISPEGDYSTLDFLPDGSFERTHPLGGVDLFSPEGLLIQRSNSAGDSSSLSYDNAFRLVRVVDSFGNTTDLTYQGAFLQSVTDPGGRTTQFAHDAQGHLIEIIDSDGLNRTFNYDPEGRMSSQARNGGEITSYRFNERLGSLEATVLPDGTERLVSPDLVDSEQEGVGVVVYAPSSSVPEPVAIHRHEGSFVDGDGNRFEVETNSFGQDIRRVGPDGATVSSEYDSEGRLVSKSLPSGLVLTYEYDAGSAKPTEITGLDTDTGASQSLSIVYSPGTDFPAEVVDANGASVSAVWDAEGRPISSTNAAGNLRTLTYGPSGQLASMTGPGGGVTRWDRDSAGQITQFTDADGYTQSYSYDALGRRTEVLDASGASRIFVWNDNNTLASVVDGLGEEIHYEYDSLRRRTAITDPSGRRIDFEYDARDRLISKTDGNGTERYEWSANGVVTAVERRSGDRNEVELDAYDRPIRKSLAVGGDTTYTYDLAGRLIETSNENATITFEYNAFGDLIRETSVGAAGTEIPSTDIIYTYDDKGRRLTTETADGSRLINYLWDETDAVVGVSEGSASVDFSFDADGRLIDASYSNSMTSSASWSPAGRLEAFEHQSSGGQLFDWSYSYDTAGMPASRVDLDGSVHIYSRDNLGAITSVDHPGSADDETYSYDSMGNRTSDHNGSYSYDGEHRLLEDSDSLYTWTDNGELATQTDKLSGEITRYTWNSDSYLTGVTRESASGILLSNISYLYDPLGRRIAKEVDGQRFYMQFAGDNMLQEMTSDGLPTARYVFGGLDTPLWKMDLQDQVTFFVSDGNGSVTGLVDEAGALIERYTYDSFGNRTEWLGSGIEQPFGLHGLPLDPETGLYCVRERYYSPQTGRFLSADRFAGFVSGALGQNPYVFAFNDPFRFQDPYGNYPFEGFFSKLNQGKLGGGATLCVKGCLGFEATISVDKQGNHRIDLCGVIGAGLGGNVSLFGSVGEGNVSEDTIFSQTAEVSVGAQAGPCSAGVSTSATYTKNLSTGCTGESTAGAGADATCGGTGIGTSFDTQNGFQSNLKTGKSFDHSRSKPAAKIGGKLGIEAAATSKTCIGGGGFF